MRLTLRTLLLYLDRHLDGPTTLQLEQRIADSEHARKIMQRVKDVVVAPRLRAPKILGKGLGKDPNSVAEYIDNTLEMDRIAEFEKGCLESDVQLAETAACHEIVSLVLREKVQVPGETRRRMYELESSIEAKPNAPGEHTRVDTIPVKEENGAPVKKEKPKKVGRVKRAPLEVPDYLREPPMWKKVVPVAAGITCVVLLVGAVWMALNPNGLSKLWNFGTSPEVAQGGNVPAGDAAAGDAATGDAPDAGTPEVGGTANFDMHDENAPPAPDAVEDPAEETPADANAPPAPDDVAAETDDEGTPAVDAADGAGDLADTEDGPGLLVPPVEEFQPEAGADSAASSPDDMPMDASAGDAAGTPEDVPAPGGAVSPPLPANELTARLATPAEVLLATPQQVTDWKRVGPNDEVPFGTRLLALTPFRPALALNANIGLQLAGNTDLALLPKDPGADANISVEHGRLILANTGEQEAIVRLQFRDRAWYVALPESGDELALEVAIPKVYGVDPATQSLLPVVMAFATRGEITITSVTAAGAEPASLAEGHAAELGAGVIPAEEMRLPTWLTAPTATPVEKRATSGLEEHLTADGSARIKLLELADHRRVEVRALAIRGLTQLGEFGAAIASLGDEAYKNYWTSNVNDLREAMFSDPRQAEVLRQALSRIRGEKGDVLYRLLWGYTSDQFNENDDEILVDYLNHEDLDLRVLAFWNLREITGSTLNYRPEFPSQSRRTYVQKWRQAINDPRQRERILGNRDPDNRDPDNREPGDRADAHGGPALPSGLKGGGNTVQEPPAREMPADSDPAADTAESGDSQPDGAPEGSEADAAAPNQSAPNQSADEAAASGAANPADGTPPPPETRN